MFKISVIIPYRKKNIYLEECLHYLSALKVKDLEVILLPDGHEQGALHEALKIKVIPTGALGPADKRDLGAQHASGDILAFIDDDAYPSATWLSAASIHFQALHIAAVTGPNVTPPTDTFWQKASGKIYENPFCSGNCTHRYRPEKKKFVDDAASCNLLVRKKDFFAVGGFQSKYYPGEDTKLCLDLIQKLKKKIVYDPEVRVFHHRRSLWKPHLHQVRQYALHRGFFMKKYPMNSLKISYAVPSFFLLYCLGIPVLMLLKPSWLGFWILPLLVYFTGLLLTTKPNTSWALTAATTAGAFLTHITYGWALLKLSLIHI